MGYYLGRRRMSNRGEGASYLMHYPFLFSLGAKTMGGSSGRGDEEGRRVVLSADLLKRYARWRPYRDRTGALVDEVVVLVEEV